MKKITLSRNLAFLRREHHYSQEEIAEKIGVTRQSIAKWENGESLPDIINCDAIANLFDVSLDNLIHYDQQENALPIPPKGKHMFGTVALGKDGTVRLPEKAINMVNMKKGDMFLILGDENPESIGIALVPVEFFTAITQNILDGGKELKK
ncbi:helix-turn-helix transcriptional regulator [Gracilibacillus alcaliphilus]|uniref:helix-turn-helix transcriptional regulator n=1 Tax=Gracilibacillus alcaliphilus TaxID=1401441 RepID=UPI00195E9010|nr:helix-turn-helix transcriptional regulator [Gracilibacillus alcaliphilus]MBM7675314.1 transcriptional regulator with XRE-family HTH domain [Gracilibacillus alcaliphilus]